MDLPTSILRSVRRTVWSPVKQSTSTSTACRTNTSLKIYPEKVDAAHRYALRVVEESMFEYDQTHCARRRHIARTKALDSRLKKALVSDRALSGGQYSQFPHSYPIFGTR